MAIRFPMQHSATYGTGTQAMAASIQGGWKTSTMIRTGGVVDASVFGSQFFQPSALSRPNNNGPDWTENVSTGVDQHRPIPFSAMASLLYSTGPHPALIGR